MHNHDIKHLDEIGRRQLLQGAGLSLGVAALAPLFSLSQASAATTTKSTTLPGFSAFAKSVNIFRSGNYYMVESNGIPSHQMMVGIKSWQQQIPTPQPYSGTNAWPIPVTPVISKAPISNKGHFLRGAIAIAVNGIPIFNALNNRGDDAYLAGELDDFGGHCGRADDYHYHVAPFHLQSIVGIKSPIAYALDGFPIYGEKEIDGKKVSNLDQFNGHFDSKKKYHYHGTQGFPYINGGFKGVVKEIDGQVDPQSVTKAFRPAGAPLKGAIITACEQLGGDRFLMRYSVDGAINSIEYSATLNQVDITFTDSTGAIRNESYKRGGR